MRSEIAFCPMTRYKPLIVGPRSTALAPLLDIEPGILRQARDAQGRVLVWGWAEYDEVFGDAKRHRTEFCYQLVVDRLARLLGRLQPIQGL